MLQRQVKSLTTTLRDYGRVGLFAMSNGRLADGTEVLPENPMADSVRPSKAYDRYGYFWWLNPDGSYQAAGIFGQAIYVNAEKNVVIALHSAREEACNADASVLQYAMLSALAKAAKYP